MNTLSNLPIATLAAITLILAGCRKEEVVAPAAALTQMPGMGEFRFKLDGVQHNMLVTFFAEPMSGVPGAIATAAGSDATSSVNITFNNDRLVPGVIEAPFVGDVGFGFVYSTLGMNGAGYWSEMSTSIGELHLLQVDTMPGGSVEGEFFMNGVLLYDADHVPQQGTHSVTDGYFKIPINS